jgi:hypothetical protein
MSRLIQEEQWVWVVVQDPGGEEKFLGQYNDSSEAPFIPTFLEKDEAKQGMELLTREKGHKYEVQAIQYNDLAERAAENGFMILVLKGTGEVLEKIKF